MLGSDGLSMFQRRQEISGRCLIDIPLGYCVSVKSSSLVSVLFRDIGRIFHSISRVSGVEALDSRRFVIRYTYEVGELRVRGGTSEKSEKKTPTESGKNNSQNLLKIGWVLSRDIHFGHFIFTLYYAVSSFSSISSIRISQCLCINILDRKLKSNFFFIYSTRRTCHFQRV